MAKRRRFHEDGDWTGDDRGEMERIAYVPNADEPHMSVTFTLPRSVLIALLDSTSDMADVYGAQWYGVLDEHGEITPIGHKILAGCDQTAVRHVMLAAWREWHNRAIRG